MRRLNRHRRIGLCVVAVLGSACPAWGDDARTPSETSAHGASSSDALAAEAVSAYGRLFEALAPADRPALLAELLASRHVELVQLAADLTTRLLLNAEPVDAAVTHAAVGRLADPDARVRLLAAALLVNLDPASAADRARERLAAEDTPAIRVKLLDLLRAAPPDQRSVRLALSLLNRSPEVSAAAMRLIDAQVSDYRSLPVQSRARLERVVAALDAASMTSAQVRIAAGVMPTPAREVRLSEVLHAAAPDAARAAARALLPMPDHATTIAAAARSRTALAELGVQALATHRSDPHALRTALSIELSGAARGRAMPHLAALAASLAEADLAEVLRESDDHALRLGASEPVIERWRRPPDASSPPPSTPDPALALLLAQSALATDQPTLAVQIVSMVPAESDGAGLARAHVRGLLALARIDDAKRITLEKSVPRTVWDHALRDAERSDNDEARSMLAAVIDELWNGDASE